ncbi:OprO/OprP family phosphate-selective porin [Oligoflexia bacterium]|nr:OprO/OprP family phosphate-selective porin [Oligoflexia bacterium]
MKIRVLWAVCLAIVFTGSSAWAGPKWEFGEDSWMKLGFLGQVHYSFMEDAADEHDFYLRRGRLILSGQITDGVKFFAETDNDNAGKNGAGSTKTDIQDAFVDIQLGDSSHWVQAGLILLPFSLENRSSAASLLGLDYNVETIKFVNTFVWRDYGTELHGTLGDRVGYHIGAFDGYDETDSIKNDDAGLRLVARVDISILGEKVPSGWFYSQNQLGQNQYLVAGAGYNHQDDATLDSTLASPIEEDSKAWVVDFQSSLPLAQDWALLTNGAYYDWDNAVYKGGTAFVETGLMYDRFMGTVKWSAQDRDHHDAVRDYTIGFHYFMDRKHNLRAGAEYRLGDSSDWLLVGLQFLL